VVHLLRRVGNLPLAEVAQLAGVSPSRVCQIHAELEATEYDQRTTAVLATIGNEPAYRAKHLDHLILDVNP
jgi:hypothetical protein